MVSGMRGNDIMKISYIQYTGNEMIVLVDLSQGLLETARTTNSNRAVDELSGRAVVFFIPPPTLLCV
jgi:hypothetical protein